MGISGSVPEKSIHEFTVKDSRGKDVEISIYQGKVLLVVNVASKCGFTDTNYTQLTDLYQKYKDQGFEILAFPCNQFLNQEPGTSEEAQEFACTRYKAEYPIFQKFSQTWYFIWGLGYFDDSISLLTDDTSLLHRIGLVKREIQQRDGL